MKWALQIGNRAKRQLRRLDPNERDAIDQAFSELCENPFRGDVKFLGGQGTLRRRVGDWRIIFELDHYKRVIRVIAVKRRGSNTY